jgi:small Trp-rich protein
VDYSDRNGFYAFALTATALVAAFHQRDFTMAFVIIGVLLLALHFAGVAPFAAWNFKPVDGDLWKFVLPFGLALVWWWWSDTSGLTRRREMERDTQRKLKRRKRNVAAMGLGTKKSSDSTFGRR